MSSEENNAAVGARPSIDNTGTLTKTATHEKIAILNKIDRVAVCSRSFSQDPVLRNELLGRYQHVTFNETNRTLVGDELISFLRGHEKAIVALEVMNEKILAGVPDLKVIGKYGVGMDKIDFEALARRGIVFGWTGGVNKRSVAELTISFALSCLRGVFYSGLGVRHGKWEVFKGREFGAATIGLIGCGHVGKEVARLSRAFGTRVLAYDILDFSQFYAETGVIPASFAQVLSESDVISLHVPLTSQTRGMLGSGQFSQMKPSAFLVNTARGGIVDELALVEALRSGKLAGAAFDVFAEEPPQNSALLELPNFWATPHIGGSSRQAILAMGRAAIDGLDQYRPASDFVEMFRGCH